MSSQSLREDLKEAIQKEDVDKVHKIVLKNLDLLNHPYSSDLRFILFSNPEICRNDKISKLLVQNLEIEINEEKNFEKSLKIAVRNGNTRLAELFLKNGAKLKDLKWMKNYLARNNVSDCKEMLLLLLQYGLDINMKDKRRRNLLHNFLTHSDVIDNPGMIEIVEILLNSGISVNEPNGDGHTPINYAIFKQKIPLIELLIDKGADLDNESGFYGFPLDFAVSLNNEAIIDLLLSKGAKVNAKDVYGWTAMHAACLRQNEKVLGSLIKRGADISVENKSGETPFSYLMSSGQNLNEK